MMDIEDDKDKEDDKEDEDEDDEMIEDVYQIDEYGNEDVEYRIVLELHKTK